jgi:hypothetical protein
MDERRGDSQVSSFYVDRNFLSRFYDGVIALVSFGPNKVKRLVSGAARNDLPLGMIAFVGCYGPW